MGRERVVAFLTSTRADYGIARWVLQDIVDEPNMALQLIVTGSHLNESHGNTINEIQLDGFEISSVVKVDLSEDSPLAAAKWMADVLEGLTAALLNLAPDILLVVGDRFEALLGVQAAALARVPVAHIHGGELTQGSLDDGMRHAITKLAHVHFAATSEYGRRIIQLGEDPDSVHIVGSPGLCAILRDPRVAEDELAEVLGFSPSEPFALATYHPATAEEEADSVSGVKAMTGALARCPELRVVITGVNADPGFSKHLKVLDQFAQQNPDRVTVIDSLGHRRYLAAMRMARVCIGNSSSGIIEAPPLGLPTINIGSRQQGRLRAASIIDASPDVESVFSALMQARDPDFVLAAKKQNLPYGSGGASRRIVKILSELDLADIRSKGFRDCGQECNSWSRRSEVMTFDESCLHHR